MFFKGKIYLLDDTAIPFIVILLASEKYDHKTLIYDIAVHNSYSW